jgi:DsbC/DsbD-like thiol-disulfide interchange protein
VISIAKTIAYLARMTRTLLIAGLCAMPLAAFAEVTSQDDVLRGTMLPGWQLENGRQMAGIQLDLAPGWKTYWRSPGDAGIPPSFDWSRSTNVQSVRIHWPAPSVFQSNGLQTIGYHDQLVLPIEVVAIDPAKPMQLAADVELGVCDQICLPASLSLSTELLVPGTSDGLIKAALRSLPETAGDAGVVNVACVVDPIADGLRITASINMPKRAGTETVAIETADPSVWVASSAISREGDRLIATTEMVDRSGAPFALDRSTVTMTIISETTAVEIRGCPAP